MGQEYEASENVDDSTIVEPVKDDASTPPNSDPVSDPTTSLAVKDSSEDVADYAFQLAVKLPHEPWRIQIMVSSQEQVQDIRQSIIEFPGAFRYSCFHLEQHGKRLNDFVQLSDVQDFSPKSDIVLVEDPYTEKDARVHVMRIRELIGAVGDRIDPVYGPFAGLSLFSSVASGSKMPRSSADGVSQKDAAQEDAHAMSGYDFEAPGSINHMLPPHSDPPPKAVKALSLSPWNPPPHSFRQKGHLLYLQLTTLEGEQFQITSSVSGYFVNRCSNSKFDPLPRSPPKAASAHSLLTLISQLSPSFDTSFAAIQEYHNQKDPLATFPPSNAIPASPWVIPSPDSPLSAHVADLTRTQESYLASGMDNAETLRDWNEEFQSTRELPRDTVQERVFRERLTSKLFADYNEAAARGAVLVARGEVPALNPTEAATGQIFLYNNVFLSFGVDGVETFATEGGDEAARVATGKDVLGVRAVNQLDVPGLFTPGTVVVDYLGKRIVGQTIVPGIFKQREPGEHQVDYGGVDGKGVVAEHAEFLPVFEKLSAALKTKKHPVWDKEGKRHDLVSSVETKGLLGTDGRKYVLDLYRITPLDIAWLEEHRYESNDAVSNGDTHEQRPPYPHRMAVLRPELVDTLQKVKLKEYVSSKLKSRANGEVRNGIHRSIEPDSSRLQDDVNGTENHEDSPTGEIKKPTEQPTEKADDPPNNDISEPGQEITTQTQDENPNKEINKHAEEELTEAMAEQIDISGFDFTLNPDVFSGQSPQTSEERAEWAKDEEEVRGACMFLTSEVIPELIRDLSEGDVGFPIDGKALTRLLHRKGINIRYIGKICMHARDVGPRLDALKELAEREMLSRAFKHVANQHLRSLATPFVGPCIAHLLNCLLGSDLNSAPTAEADEELRHFYPESDFSYQGVSPESLRQDIETQISTRYRYDLEDGWTCNLKHLQLLREIALKLGLQLEARDYRFRKPPATNGVSTNGASDSTSPNGHSGSHGKKKKKGGENGVAAGPTADQIRRPTHTFLSEDIINIVPVIKEASPKSVLAEETFEVGRMSFAQDQKEVGQDLLLESLSLHEQIYGILHAEVARFYSQLSMFYYQLREKEMAVEIARKAVIVSERTLGVDSAETILSYLNLGLFEHASGNTKGALQYIRHALELWKVVYGTRHPDTIMTTNNVAVMLQHLRHYHESRLWFEASLRISDATFGRRSINTATLLFQLAQALALDHDSKAAVARMREAYTIFLAELGPADKNTREAETWLEQLTQNAVSIARHAKDLQARKLRRFYLSPRVTLDTQPQLGAGQSSSEAASGSAAAGAGAGAVGTAAVKGGGGGGSGPGGARLDSRSIEELIRFIEGGTDAKGKKASQKRPGRSNPKRRGGIAVGTPV